MADRHHHPGQQRSNGSARLLVAGKTLAATSAPSTEGSVINLIVESDTITTHDVDTVYACVDVNISSGLGAGATVVAVAGASTFIAGAGKSTVTGCAGQTVVRAGLGSLTYAGGSGVGIVFGGGNPATTVGRIGCGNADVFADGPQTGDTFMFAGRGSAQNGMGGRSTNPVNATGAARTCTIPGNNPPPPTKEL